MLMVGSVGRGSMMSFAGIASPAPFTSSSVTVITVYRVGHSENRV